MKKKLISLSLLLFIPMFVFASTKKYESTNLEETLNAEEIEVTFSNYEETDGQAVIYLFRGHNCGYCHSFLEFLNSIVDEYGKYFRLEAYEVWYTENNSELMSEVASYFGESASGVPFIVIGDKVFSGYTESYNDSIISAIKETYRNGNKNDVFKEMKKAEIKEKITDIVTKVLPIISIIGILALGLYFNKQNKKLTLRITSLEEQIEVLNKEKKSIKKTTTKKTTKSKKTKKEV